MGLVPLVIINKYKSFSVYITFFKKNKCTIVILHCFSKYKCNKLPLLSARYVTHSGIDTLTHSTLI
jgi:hypothetical protein